MKVLFRAFGFFLIFQIGGVCAQTHGSFIDEFDDNSRDWSVSNTGTLESGVKGGKYFLNRAAKPGGSLIIKSFHYQTKGDYIIEAKFKQNYGGKKEGYGLVWDGRDNMNSKNFTINGKRQFKIYDFRNGKYVKILNWTKSKWINKRGKENVLKIQKTGSKLRYFINGSLVCTSNAQYPYGEKIGFTLNNKMSVEVDYVKFQQTDWSFEREINLVELSPEDLALKKENLTANINSPFCEKGPVISPDGKILYYDRNDHPFPDGHKGTDKIWFSLKDEENDSWSEGIYFGPPFNNKNHNFVVATSSDNNTVYLGNTYKPNGSYGGRGLSVSNLTSDGWEIPREIPIQNLVNYDTFVNYFISPNRKLLLCSIENQGTFGHKDLVVYFEENGGYVNPINLGPGINTGANESSPYLAADNKTLYFASAGWPGYGSADIFVSKRLDDSWTNWSEPQNLGPVVNSPKWDAYYSIAAQGDYAYVVSKEESLGEEDIFRIKQAKKAKPEPVLLVHGKVYNSKTKEPVQAEIAYFDLITEKVEGLALSSASNGTYTIVLPYGKKYSVLAYRDDFYSVSDFLDLSHIDEYTEVERDLYIEPIVQNQVVELHNLFFEEEGAGLKPESHQELTRLVTLLNDHPSMKISIESYANDEVVNHQLSEARAKAVVAYLNTHGISSDRVNIDVHDLEEDKIEHSKDIEFKILEE